VSQEQRERLAVNKLTISTFAMHFYDSVVVLEKRPIGPPRESMTGTPSF
jgi:hypothetical protein